MNKHTDLKVAAYVFQALGLITFLISFWYTALTHSGFFLIYGVIGFAWLYAIGGALLVLIDIAKSVRASAMVAIEHEEERRKTKAKLVSNGKPLGLQRVNAKKRKHA